MKRRTFLLGTAAALAAPVHAQTAWPHGQPIRVIVPFPAGAAYDAMGVALVKAANFPAQ